jgi:Type II CAAX prenyl endopeptidase Rce1-like
VIQLNASEALRRLIEDLLALATALPLVMAGLRNQVHPDRLRLVSLSALVFLSTNLATSANSIFGIKQPGGLHWNWVGKLACLIVLALLVPVLPSGTLQKSGILRAPTKSSALSIFVVSVFCALLGWTAGVAPGVHVGRESLAFQLLMPSLAEEPVYRAILPALLGTALGSPWKLAGAQVGWWWLVCSMLFGAGHGIVWSHQDGLQFHAVLFVATGIVGLLFGWLAARCLSVWPCVICHSLINATGLVVAMAHSA